MRKSKKIKLELLAPAKNADVAIEAIKCGADAIYMGASRFGARAMAGNTLDDIKRVVEYAHQFNVKVYITINTIIYDEELKDVEALIHELYKIGVDALIVQDMAILRMNLPPIALHASTQCDIRTQEKAKFLEDVGFSQIVLARELTLDEIKTIKQNVKVPLEAFIHGALCVSYSGRCGVSYACRQRSANRGECAQFCRLPYNLIDDKNNIIVKNKHLLSLKDMNQSNNIAAMIEAGVSSFKIEGRLKDVDYVKNVVAYYRNIIDDFIKSNEEKYERSSAGKSYIDFVPKLDKVFNRSFTSYFLMNRVADKKGIASINTPKSLGEFAGKVISVKGNSIKIKSNIKINNGDGLSYFNESGEYEGFRVNKIVNDTIFTIQPLKIAKGTELLRTYDKCFSEALEKNTVNRKIKVNFTLRMAKNDLILDADDERGNAITTTLAMENTLELAKSFQGDRQKDVLSKTGNTIYEADNITVLGDYFIPNSLLAELKRKAIEVLDKAQIINYDYDWRRPEKIDAPFYKESLETTDNVANEISAKFYRTHGVKDITYAIEHKCHVSDGNEVLMHTRYCILKELGCCRKDKNAKKLPAKLYLTNERVKLIIETDCAVCEMKIKRIE